MVQISFFNFMYLKKKSNNYITKKKESHFIEKLLNIHFIFKSQIILGDSVVILDLIMKYDSITNIIKFRYILNQ